MDTDLEKEKKLMIYTDGSALLKNLYGAWAFVVLDEDENIVYKTSCVEKNVSNNQMEYKAFLEAIEYLDKTTDKNSKIEFFVDAQNLVEFLNGLKNPQEKNKIHPSLRPLSKAIENKFLEFTNLSVTKVKSHSGLKWNNYVDKMAYKKATKKAKNDQEFVSLLKERKVLDTNKNQNKAFQRMINKQKVMLLANRKEVDYAETFSILISHNLKFDLFVNDGFKIMGKEGSYVYFPKSNGRTLFLESNPDKFYSAKPREMLELVSGLISFKDISDRRSFEKAVETFQDTVISKNIVI